MGGGESHDLDRGIARVAGCLGRLLESRFPGPEAIIAHAIDFLNRAARRPPRDATSGATPLVRLIDAYHLDLDNIDLLILAGLADEHEGFADIFRTLHPLGQPRPTAGLATQLLELEGRARLQAMTLLETGPAVRSGILRLDGEGPLFERDLVTTAGLWSRLHGIEVTPPGVVLDRAHLTRAGLSDWLKEPQTRAVMEAIASGDTLTLVVAADSARTAFRRAAVLVKAAGREALRMEPPAEPNRDLMANMAVHAIAAHRVPVLCIGQGDGAQRRDPSWSSNYPAALVLCCRAGDEPALADRTLLRILIERPSTRALVEMWRTLLPELPHAAQDLATRFPLEPDQALRAITDLRRVAPGVPDLHRVSSAVRARSVSRLNGGVQHIRPVADWDSLVLPDGQMEQLREAANRLRLQSKVLDEWRFLAGRRGARGVRLLLSGPSGTGKTLSAEVLAKALDVDLLLVDLSRVVSKWIGETEKNLAAVFETAEQARAVLLFDEAEGLFGSRTQVSDAHDRYANLETAYLLSRLERFDGLAALSTNLRQNIDSAFLRRLDFIIDYEEPDRHQRLALWQCHLPPEAPLADDLDLAMLAAHFPIVGGLIRNASVAAAFLAADEGTPIARRHLLRAIRREYDKVGKPYREPPQ